MQKAPDSHIQSAFHKSNTAVSIQWKAPDFKKKKVSKLLKYLAAHDLDGCLDVLQASGYSDEVALFVLAYLQSGEVGA